MTTQNNTTGKTTSRVAISLVLVLAAFLIGAVATISLARTAKGSLAEALGKLLNRRSTQYISSGDVVEKVQGLHRLETVVYSLDSVVEGRESSRIFPDALAGDKLLMIVHGQTIAGIDFSRITPDRVHIDDDHGVRTLHVVLPPAEIFLTTIDNTKSRVYARDTGLFISADPNLESATRLRAQNELQQAALSDGILSTAQANARETMRVLLGNLGFARVDVE